MTDENATHRATHPYRRRLRGVRSLVRRATTTLVLVALLVLTAPAPGRAATDAELLRRHAPGLVLDAREPGPPVAVGAFLRGARGDRARRSPPRVYGHAVRDGGRLWLQYWFFRWAFGGLAALVALVLMTKPARTRIARVLERA